MRMAALIGLSHVAFTVSAAWYVENGASRNTVARWLYSISALFIATMVAVGVWHDYVTEIGLVYGLVGYLMVHFFIRAAYKSILEKKQNGISPPPATPLTD